ncbi:response regulator [Aureliella helgolandensis]|uniref:Response regulator ArlR n=1 Tax=Aureliella helgolandensis TaxID=2527968 RepID=A0A518GFM3_9BACT|nr:response regulator transcription factor [Aureliella helgolandensis]QDV27384.1 Response regulator ArlR [Aureliella helgolandensis]
MSKTKVLIIEDDHSLSDILFYNLQKEGFNVFCAFDGREGIEQAMLKQPDIIVLDLMLPRVNGMDVCRHLRKQKETRHAGILMLTAKGEDLDQIDGFEAGADDYVVKPYSVRVLLERIRALQRRRTTEEASEPAVEALESMGIRVDLRRHEASLNGTPLELTRSEFKLLHTLIAEPGKAFDRSELIESALGEDTLVLERTIDVHIRAIRKKLGDISDAIETVRGVGYRFKEPTAPTATSLTGQAVADGA